MPQRDRAYYEGLLNDPRARAMLDLIAAGEVDADGFRAGNGYDALFNGGRAKDLSKHPNVSTDFQGKKTTAAGRYQFLYSTWTPLAKRLGLKDFSSRSQDIAALALADEAGALDHFLEGRFAEGIQKLGDQWASMPNSKWRHGNTHSPSFFYDVYVGSLRRNDPTNKYANPTPPADYRQTNAANILDAKPYNSARGDFSGGAGGGGGPNAAGGGRFTLKNTNVDLSKMPDMSNWDADNYTAQMMFNRYGNRRLLATHPGQWNESTATLLSAALLEPKPPVLYSPLPYPQGQTTVLTQESGNRATPAVHPEPAQPQAQTAQDLSGGPTFYPEQSDTPLQDPMFTLGAPVPNTPQTGRDIPQSGQTQKQQPTTTQKQAAAAEQPPQQQAEEQKQEAAEQETGAQNVNAQLDADAAAAAATLAASASGSPSQTAQNMLLLRDMGLPNTGTAMQLDYDYLRLLQDRQKYLRDNEKRYALLTSGNQRYEPGDAAFVKNYETQQDVYAKIINNVYDRDAAMKALDPYRQTAEDYTGSVAAAATQQDLMASLNPFWDVGNPVTRDLEQLLALNQASV